MVCTHTRNGLLPFIPKSKRLRNVLGRHRSLCRIVWCTQGCGDGNGNGKLVTCATMGKVKLAVRRRTLTDSEALPDRPSSGLVGVIRTQSQRYLLAIQGWLMSMYPLTYN
jgi:hypothetical protein